MMRYHMVFCLVLFCSAFPLVGAQSADVSQNFTKNIDAVIQPYNKYVVFGGAILIAKGNNVIY
ncbi:MAG: hypothetical protein ACJAXM_000898 [Arenicella sp.]|jgi:hypothetical protein